jgi:hypothetical protein
MMIILKNFLILLDLKIKLIYSFGFEKRLPRGFEVASIALFAMGVFLTVRSQFKPASEASAV